MRIRGDRERSRKPGRGSAPRRVQSMGSVVAALGAVMVVVVGCGDPPPPFEVRSAMPGPDGGPVRLNEPLAWVFTADVDPSSVSVESVVVSSKGARVDGEVTAQGARITFQPSPSSRVDLSDGAFPPDARIDVRIGAFPARTGVRAADGRPLATPYHTSFRTLALTPPGPHGPFLDVVPNHGPSVTMGPDLIEGWVRVRFSEPLWPGAIQAGTVGLLYDDLDRTRVESEVRLVQGVDHADLFVRPVAGLVSGTPYLLLVAEGISDLVGDTMRVPFSRRFVVDLETAAMRVNGAPGERH